MEPSLTPMLARLARVLPLGDDLYEPKRDGFRCLAVRDGAEVDLRRWVPGEMEQNWVPVAPELVADVGYDQLADRRFRHPGRFRRWRPDRDPESCGLEQLEAPGADLAELLP